MMDMDKITFKVVDGITYFSCGCKSQKIGTNFVFVPCRPGCPVASYTIRETVRQGKQISIQMDNSKAKR